jgi:hypothetical protein
VGLASVAVDSLYPPVCLFHLHASCFLCDLSFLFDLRRVVDFQFVQLFSHGGGVGRGRKISKLLTCRQGSQEAFNLEFYSLGIYKHYSSLRIVERKLLTTPF